MGAVSCSENTPDSDILNPQDNEISFVTSIYPPTRVVSDKFEAGNEISVYAKDGEALYSDNVSYAYTNGKFVSATPIIYKDTKQNLTFYATYPAMDVDTKGFTFEIESDQSASKNFEISDLLTAETSATNNLIPELTFYHRMSMIVVDMIGDAEGGVASISAKNQAVCNLVDGEFTATGTNVTITPADNSSVGFKLLIAPQTIAAGEVFATYIVDGKTYTWDVDTSLVFEAGKQYTFDWSLGDRAVTATGVIEGWDSVDGGTIKSE